MNQSPKRWPASNRRGTTTVEFALTAPILFLLILAGIEFSRASVLINSAKVAASEGARCGIVMGTTAGEIETVVRKELSMVGVAHADVMVDPDVVTDDTDLVTVGVSVPLDHRNGYVIPKFFIGEHVFKITAIPREAKNDAQMTERLNASFEKMKDKLKSKAASSGKKPPTEEPPKEKPPTENPKSKKPSGGDDDD